MAILESQDRSEKNVTIINANVKNCTEINYVDQFHVVILSDHDFYFVLYASKDLPCNPLDVH